jgi:hypothetical protein
MANQAAPNALFQPIGERLSLLCAATRRKGLRQ